MEHLDSLQRQFGKDLRVICVTREDDKTVKSVFARLFPKIKPSFLTVTTDTLLEKYFPHQTIPHCVWIDRTGKVIAITDKSSVNSASIKLMLAGNSSQVINKPELKKLDLHKPPYASKQLSFEDEFLYHSLITRYREDIKSNYSRSPKNDYIACTNSSILRLYQCAAGKFDLSWLDMNRVVCKGFKTFADSASIGLFKSEALTNNWLSNMKDYAFTYELAVSDTVFSKDELFAIMFQDLNRYFSVYGLNVSKEKGSHKVLALNRIKYGNFKAFTDTSALSEKYGDKSFLKIANEPMKFLMSQLRPYLREPIPLINETGYEGKVNLQLNIEGRDVTNLNKALAIYGLELIEKEVPIDVLTITKTEGKKRLY